MGITGALLAIPLNSGLRHRRRTLPARNGLADCWQDDDLDDNFLTGRTGSAGGGRPCSRRNSCLVVGTPVVVWQVGITPPERLASRKASAPNVVGQVYVVVQVPAYQQLGERRNL